jgi:hypothetical protein
LARRPRENPRPPYLRGHGGQKLRPEGRRRRCPPLNEDSIGAETALSKGIAAQKSGTIGEALSYYYNAVSFEPSLSEARGRLSILSSNISSDNIGQSARNAIAYRNAWKNILMECDEFLKVHVPFEIVYDPAIKQQGKINYDAGTLDLKFSLVTKPTTGFDMINDVIKGLDKTGCKEEWGVKFSVWPFLESESIFKGIREEWAKPSIFSFRPDPNHDRAYYYGKEINAVFVLINEEGKTISTTSSKINCEAGFVLHNIYGEGEDVAKISPKNTKYDIIFSNVNANDISDVLTIRVLTVDGIDAELAGRNGYIRITKTK